MNLEDVLAPECGLQQDDYSLSGAVFVDQGQLKVIGWSGRNGNTKCYILKCDKCSEDSELFGDGVFRSLRGNLVKGRVPCGCSKNPKWTKEQYHTLCSRKAIELGYTFLGFVGEWRGYRTKVKMFCEKHGEWSSGIIDTLINQGSGCPGCGVDVKTKPDEAMIASFFNSGAFHPDTKFWRSGRLNSKGFKPYWFMQCGECGETGESISSSLQGCHRPCACSKHRQKECYINWIIDGDSKVALKFGIARDSKQRVKEQNSKTSYEVIQYQVYTFLDITSCKKAERECKKELDCGILLKRDMPDGWSETTWVYNLSKIQDIYKRNGGELV